MSKFEEDKAELHLLAKMAGVRIDFMEDYIKETKTLMDDIVGKIEQLKKGRKL